MILELYHQQLQGVPKNKKNSSSAARSKNQQTVNKIINNIAKEQVQVSTAKEIIVKKEKKVLQCSTPVSK